MKVPEAGYHFRKLITYIFSSECCDKGNTSRLKLKAQVRFHRSPARSVKKQPNETQILEICEILQLPKVRYLL